MATRAARINRRVVSTKRHTVGYVITGGRQVSREEAVSMALKGQLSGVRVISGPTGEYLQSTTVRSLQELPVTIQSNN